MRQRSLCCCHPGRRRTPSPVSGSYAPYTNSSSSLATAAHATNPCRWTTQRLQRCCPHCTTTRVTATSAWLSMVTHLTPRPNVSWKSSTPLDRAACVGRSRCRRPDENHDSKTLNPLFCALSGHNARRHPRRAPSTPVAVGCAPTAHAVGCTPWLGTVAANRQFPAPRSLSSA